MYCVLSKDNKVNGNSMKQVNSWDGITKALAINTTNIHHKIQTQNMFIFIRDRVWNNVYISIRE